MAPTQPQHTTSGKAEEEGVGLMMENLEDGEVVLWEANEAASPRWRPSKATVLALGAVGLLAGTLGVMSRLPGARAPVRAEAEQSVGLNGGVGDMLDSLTAGLETAAKIVKDSQSTQKDFSGSIKNFGKPFMDGRKEALAEKPPKNETDRLAGLRGEDLFPKRNKANDGNSCPKDEEELSGLCYRKCSDLTDGLYPIRTTPFACCRDKPCSMFNSKMTSIFKICQGMDRAGRREGGQCPHMPGDCLRNEEYLLGTCYKKCSVLSNNQFVFRTGPNTCCKYQTKIACLDPVNTNASDTFNVGGGINDPKYMAEFGEAHTPIPALAEVQTTTTLPTLAPVELPPPVAPPMAVDLPPLATVAPPPPLPAIAAPPAVITPALPSVTVG